MTHAPFSLLSIHLMYKGFIIWRLNVSRHQIRRKGNWGSGDFSRWCRHSWRSGAVTSLNIAHTSSVSGLIVPLLFTYVHGLLYFDKCCQVIRQEDHNSRETDAPEPGSAFETHWVRSKVETKHQCPSVCVYSLIAGDQPSWLARDWGVSQGVALVVLKRGKSWANWNELATLPHHLWAPLHTQIRPFPRHPKFPWLPWALFWYILGGTTPSSQTQKSLYIENSMSWRIRRINAHTSPPPHSLPQALSSQRILSGGCRVWVQMFRGPKHGSLCLVL